MIMHVLLILCTSIKAGRKQIVLHFAWRTPAGLLFFFLLHHLHLLVSLWYSLLVILSCKHFLFFVIYSIGKAVIHSLFYPSDNYFFQSILYPFHSSSFLLHSFWYYVTLSPLYININIITETFRCAVWECRFKSKASFSWASCEGLLPVNPYSGSSTHEGYLGENRWWVSLRKSALKEYQFLTSINLAICELETE